MWQCVAVCCSVLQCVAVCGSVLQCVAVCCSVLQCVAVCCSVLKCTAAAEKTQITGDLYCCSVLLQQERHTSHVLCVVAVCCCSRNDTLHMCFELLQCAVAAGKTQVSCALYGCVPCEKLTKPLGANCRARNSSRATKDFQSSSWSLTFNLLGPLQTLRMRASCEYV